MGRKSVSSCIKFLVKKKKEEKGLISYVPKGLGVHGEFTHL